MTLILTLMRPGEGIWQTVDARVTRDGNQVDDFAWKQLSIHRGDGTLLLAYTGLAEIRARGETMFDWLRSTLRGEIRNIEGDLLFLQERLTRDIGRSPYWRIPLTIVAAGMLGTRPNIDAPLQDRRMARWTLTNQLWPDGPHGQPKVTRKFHLAGELVDQPCGLVKGSVEWEILRTPSDMALLNRALVHRPNNYIDYLGLLAKVNRRAAPRSKGTVSPWCSGTYMPESGQPLEGRIFTERGDPQPTSFGVDSILFGIDLTEVTREGMVALQNLKLGLPPPETTDLDRSVEPRP